MYNNKKFLAIIPARGGSKGLKNKNIRILNGKPLIYYTIEAAKRSKIFDVIMVTTDSKEIAEISKKYGASIPFLRPDELSTDTASSIDVILHTLNYYVSKNINFDYFCLLQPTSPLRKAEDIINSVELLFKKDAESIVSLCEVEHSPLFANTLSEDQNLSKFIRKEVKNTRRQDLPKYYRINGAIYISKVQSFLKTKDFYGERSFAYIMPPERSVDIDTEFDLKIAEEILKSEKQ
jgi:CMP-N,N'-diacetyllegionaminic acid synthase